MKLVIRYGLAALLIVVAIILVVPPFAASLIEQWSQSDVESRSVLAFNSALDELTRQLDEHDSKKVIALFDRMALDEELLAVGFCDQHGALLYKTKQMPKAFNCKEATLRKTPTFSTVRLDRLRLLVSSFPVAASGEQGHLVLVHDLALVKQRGAQAWLWTIVVLVGVVFLAAAFAALVTVLLARRWLQSLRRAIDNVRLGGSGALEPSEAPLFAREFRHLLRDLQLTDISADGPDVDWSPAMLRNVLTASCPTPKSSSSPTASLTSTTAAQATSRCRSPRAAWSRRSSPMMRACGGTWVAHGSGSADQRDRRPLRCIPVPPDSPRYTLRRVWLTDEEQNGYYYGLANEGMWPLCHIAFVRPNFRECDWNQYQRCQRPVRSRRWSTEAKRAGSDHPGPGLPFRPAAEPDSQAAAEGHHHNVLAYPLAQAEIFSICPWKEEIIAGLLGSSVLGFHTQFHCNNFLETVDRFIESRIDREHVVHHSAAMESFVRPYPISIEWPPAGMEDQKPVAECRAAVRARLGLAEHMRLGVGIERFDYTKGILDRLRAVDAFLTSHPEWKNQFVFLQVAAPTRGKLADLSARCRGGRRSLPAKSMRGTATQTTSRSC